MPTSQPVSEDLPEDGVVEFPEFAKTPFRRVLHAMKPPYARFYLDAEARLPLDEDESAAALIAVGALNTALELVRKRAVKDPRLFLVVSLTHAAGKLHAAVGQCRKPDDIQTLPGRLADASEALSDLWRRLIAESVDPGAALVEALCADPDLVVHLRSVPDDPSYQPLGLPAFHEAALSLIARLRLAAAVLALAHDGHVPLFPGEPDLLLGERLAVEAFFEHRALMLQSVF